MSTTAPLSEKSLVAIDREIAKYPKNKQASAVMSALRIAQQEKGWLSTDTIAFVASYLSIPKIRAHEVPTFYNMYNLKPVGRHKLCLCTNLPCLLGGAMKTANALKAQLNIEFGQTTDDNEWTLKEGECFGACNDAPVIIVNNEKMYAKIDANQISDFLHEIKAADPIK